MHRNTVTQPQGRNMHLGALFNPAQVKSQSSLLDSANKRDAKSKLFGGKKSNQFSLSKKQSGVSHPDLLATGHARSKKTIGHNPPQAVLSGGNQTLS